MAAADDNDVQLMVGHTFEYNPAVRQLRDIIRSGELGRVLYVDSARLSLGLYQRDVNVIWDLAPHDISIASYLLDELPVATSVWAHRNIGPWREDVAYLRLDFPSTHAFVHVSWLNPHKVRRTTVVGERRMAVYDDMSDNERIRIYDIGVDPRGHRRPAHGPRDAGDLPDRRHHLPVRPVPGAAPGAGPRVRRLHPHRCPLGHPGRARARHRPRPRRDGRVHGDREGRTGAQPVDRGARREGLLVSDRDTDGAVDPEGAVPAPVPFLDLHGVHAALREPLDQAWTAVLGHGRFIGGPEVAAFEGAFAEYCEAEHCVGVANGTDALELILAGLGIGPGDEVIVPTNTFVATAEAVVAVGATPRFVDVLPDTLLIDPDAAAAAVGPRTAAIMAVHLFGQMADMPALSALASQHGLALIEDAAQAHGARFAGRRAGSCGVAAGFSFYPGKNLGALGDGGAVVSDDAALVDRIRRLADHGRSQTDRYAPRGRRPQQPARHAPGGGAAASSCRRWTRRTGPGRRLSSSYRQPLPAWCVPVAVHPHAEPVHHLAVVQVPDRAAAAARPRRRRHRLGHPLPGALPPAARVRPVRDGAAARRRGRGGPHPVAAAVARR